MKKTLYIFLWLLLAQGAAAQNWNQIIKTAAADRRTLSPLGRGVSDFFGYSVAVDGDYAVVGARLAAGDTVYGAGSVIIFRNVGGIWGQVKKIVANDRGVGDQFGYSVAISGNLVVVGTIYEDQDAAGGNQLTNAGSAYIFSKDQGGPDNWGQVKKIVANDRAVEDEFGFSVAISGKVVVVGAHYEDQDAAGGNTLSEAGAAYVFSKDQGGPDNWGQVKKIVANDRGRLDNFGCSVAISGNVVVVGAWLGNEFAGSAYIFSKDQGGPDNWGQVKKIVANDRAADDRFGYSVAISGNVVVVGAWLENHDAAGGNQLLHAGSAYIFSKDWGGPDNWGQVKKIVANDRTADDRFGYSVAISGNVVVMGTPFEDEDAAGGNTRTEAGSAYVFSKDQGGPDNWGQVKKIVANDRAADDWFGHSVAISGNVVVVGAYQEDEDPAGGNTLTNAGSAYVFSQDQGGNNNWGQQQKITLGEYTPNQYYGYSVAIDGDWAVVGTYGAFSDANGSNHLANAGAAYLIQKVGGTWTQVKKIVAADRAASDNFGYSVAISGNVVVVGACQEDEDAVGGNTFSNAGSAYVFSKDQGGGNNWGQVKKIVANDRAANDQFGYSVAISGNVVVVGTPFEDQDAVGDNTLSNAGSAYVFSKDQGGPNNWGQVKKIVAADRAANDWFGYSVAIAGNVVVMGVPNEDQDVAGGSTLSNAGLAYVFSKDQGGLDNWGQVKKIVAADRGSNDLFGYSVAISGNVVVVGAYQEDQDAAGGNTLADAGSAYVFGKDQGGLDNWGQVKKIVANDRTANDQFGRSVAISGNVVVVGAYQEDEDAAGGNMHAEAGSAYVFGKDQGGGDNWGQFQKIVASDRAAGDFFGRSVAISGNTLVVGAYQEDEDAAGGNTLSNAGSAYFFTSAPNPCPPLLIVSNITSGTVNYTASQITATNQISNANVTYSAANSITILPGFVAERQSIFKAEIKGCP